MTTTTNAPPLQTLYQIAEPQAGYFTATQGNAAGYSRQQLSYHARSGRFMRIRPGIYRLALFPASPYEDLFVAWLRLGSDAVLSHQTALALYELSDTLPAQIHATIPRSKSRRHPGLRLHTNSLRSDEVTQLYGLPVTTPLRTMADVAQGGLSDELIIQAIRQSIERGLATAPTLLDAAAQYGGRVGALIRCVLKDGE